MTLLLVLSIKKLLCQILRMRFLFHQSVFVRPGIQLTVVSLITGVPVCGGFPGTLLLYIRGVYGQTSVETATAQKIQTALLISFIPIIL